MPPTLTNRIIASFRFRNRIIDVEKTLPEMALVIPEHLLQQILSNSSICVFLVIQSPASLENNNTALTRDIHPTHNGREEKLSDPMEALG